MKMLFLIGELYGEGAGASEDLFRVIEGLKNRYEDFDYFIITHRYLYPSPKFPINKVLLWPRYYSSALGDRRLQKKIMEYDMVYIRQTLEYVLPSIRSGKRVIFNLPHVDELSMLRGKTKFLAFFTRMMIHPLLKNVDIVITATPEFSSVLLNKFNIKSIVVPDIVGDIWLSAIERRRRRRISTGVDVNLIHVGDFELDGRKRTGQLLNVIRGALESYPKLKLRMVGMNKYKSYLASKYAENLGIEENVIIEDHLLSEEQLLEEYTKSDIYVTTTTYEGFYRPIIEAFMTGMPAIVYDARLITHNQGIIAQVNHVLKSGAGLLFDGTVTSFLEALREIIKNYNYYSEKAVEYSYQFKSERIIDKYQKIIDHLRNGHNGAKGLAKL